MAQCFLAVYTLRIKMKGKNGNYVHIDNIQNGTDFLDIMNSYLSNRHINMTNQKVQKKLLKIRNFKRENRIFSGTIETGEYGYETGILDVNSGNTTHIRRVTEAEMLPFYFLIYLPQNANEGILILQRFKQFGIRTILESDINKYISLQFSQFKLKVQINPLIPSQLIEQYMKGRILKLRLIRFSLPPDIADAYDTQDHIEEGGYTEYVISARKKGSIPIIKRIREVLSNERQLNKLVEIQGFEYDNVKVEIDLYGSKITMDLSDISKLRAYMDVSQFVSIGDDGHPSFESIDKIAKDLLNDLCKKIRVDNNV